MRGEPLIVAIGIANPSSVIDGRPVAAS